MLWILGVALIALWAIGLAFKVTTGLIHLALIAALAFFAIQMFTGRRHARRALP
jgi:hypothetical protein